MFLLVNQNMCVVALLVRHTTIAEKKPTSKGHIFSLAAASNVMTIIKNHWK